MMAHWPCHSSVASSLLLHSNPDVCKGSKALSTERRSFRRVPTQDGQGERSVLLSAHAAEGRARGTAVFGPADADGTVLSLPKDLHEEAQGSVAARVGEGLAAYEMVLHALRWPPLYLDVARVAK